MLEIKQDKIIVDGVIKEINKMNVINLSRNYLSFSSNIADCTPYDKDINSFYTELLNAGYNNLLLFDNNIINLNNIMSLHIEFYQYAGISIHKCSQANAELYHLNLVCRNGKKETIPFRTFKEAEECYYVIDTALTQLRNGETEKGLLESC